LSAVPRAPKTEGYFYAVQVVPELAPQWVKFGRTNNVTRRLKEHRTVAPTALLLAAWPADRCHEVAAIMMLVEGGTMLSSEVWKSSTPND